MRVLVAYDEAAGSGGREARDVLDQAEAVAEALTELGHDHSTVPVSPDFAAFKRELAAFSPDVVFNLVESLENSDRLQAAFPLFLEDWGVAHTGCSSRAMVLTNHKALAKTVLRSEGIPFPGCAWLDGRNGEIRFLPREGGNVFGGPDRRWIVKLLESHSSLFLDDGAVAEFADARSLAGVLAERSRVHGKEFFAERFVDGREFNVSLVETGDGEATALPPAEIRFLDFPEEKPRIVGYDAKWLGESREYVNTPRSFDFADADRPLLTGLETLALDCWKAFSLSGYARVDFRVDAGGRPFVLEVNANPALTPDAGLAAAAGEFGWPYRELCRRILHAARRSPVSGKKPALS